jgi:hypothetical protein
MRPRDLLHAMSLGIALVVLAAPAMAAGVNLSWNDCYPGGGTTTTNFSCDTDIGTHRLIGTFVPPAGMDSIIAMDVVLDLCSMPEVLPDWWRVIVPGSCREDAVDVSFDFSGRTACADPWGGQAMGLTNAAIEFQHYTRLRVVMSCALPQQVEIVPGQEYYAFEIRISNAHTTGPDACTGCNLGACIVLNEIVLSRTNGAAVVLTNPADDYMAVWQSSSLGYPCPFIVPVKASTWGQIKATYR